MASFNSAFASARKSGKSTFTWNGKSYSTKMAADTPKKGPVPKSSTAEKSGASRSTANKVEPKKTSEATSGSRGSGKNPKDMAKTSVASRGSGDKPTPAKAPVPTSRPKNERSETKTASGKTSRLSKLPDTAPTPTSRKSVSKNVLGFEVNPRKKYKLK